MHKSFFFLSLISLLLNTRHSYAEHYVQLKNGQEVKCAILRQDTAVVVVTEWASRNLAQPPLQVFALDEVQSIWFQKPSIASSARRPYIPHPSGLEVGGGFSFQQWAESTLKRRSVLLVSLHGGYSIARQLGLEADAAFTLPFGGSQDTLWKRNDTGYQAAMTIVGHPWSLGGFVPFALAGGGAAVGVPLGDVLLTSSKDIRNLIVVGCGAKWGWNGLGFRTEVRHHFYTWTPDEVNEFGVRVSEHSADATVVRFSMFLYK